MKKKLALLLAATMTMTLLPMNLFAATQNTITNVSYVVKNGTVFFEDGMIATGKAGEITNDGGGAGSRGDLRYAVNGGSLVLYPQNGSMFAVNDSFQVRLTNGEWFFKNYDSPVAQINADPLYAAGGAFDSADLAAKMMGSATTLLTGAYHGSFAGGNYGLATLPIPGTPSVNRNYDTTKGLFYSPGPAAQTAVEGVYVRTPDLASFTPPTSNTLTAEVGYTMAISQADPTLATVKVYNVPTMGTLGRPAAVTIPLAVFGANGSQDISVSILQGAQASAPTPQQLPYAIGGGGGTTAAESTAPNPAPIIGRKTFELNPLMIRENRIAAIGNKGAFEIQAPDGFHFQDPNTMNSRSKKPTVSVEGGLGSVNPAGVNYVIGFNKNGNTIDNSVMVVGISGMNNSNALQGQLNINDLVLIADNDANYTDISVNFVNRAMGKGSTVLNLGLSNPQYYGTTDASDIGDDLDITAQTLLVARRLNYSIDFKTTSTVPTLYSGRNNYDNTGTISSTGTATGNGGYSSTNYDLSQKAATVFFAELAQTSWWSQRETVFALPDGVKFNQVKFHDTDNLNASDDFDGAVFKPSTQNNSTKDYPNTTPVKNSATNIEVEPNKITMNSIEVDYGTTGNKLADFEMDIWLSISPDFEGPVNLTATGSGVPTDVAPITIANAIAPVKVTVDKVSDVKIGYQYQPVSNITITENGIAALLKGKTMKVSVSDMISTDLSMDPHASVAVTGGDLKVSNISTNTVGSATDPGIFANSNGTGNAISFTIDRQSSTSPATIVISNVAVKVDRNVPQTNYTPYKVVVWGDAVAQNFNTNTVLTNGVANYDEFGVRGITTDFIKVVSAANDASSVLTQEVRMPIGQSTFTINGVTSDMAATSYISTKSNSAMVPVRFVAEAFGLTADQIIWDQKAKTATLMTPSGKVIQFKADSTEMVVNQVVIPMLSLDTPPLPVAAEFDAAAGRIYIPFRALGNAFGVPVAFDTATNTAIYNAGANVTSTTTAQ